ncbi:hypothetical protein FQR65_LT20961 [Abscondita terminalis]|nr:hypothetical protein FQR65_LT20961 [Abscondita terminalis]
MAPAEGRRQVPHAGQQQHGQREQLEVDGHIPDAGRQGLLAHDVLQQQRMGQQLAQVGLAGDRGMVEPGPHGRRHHDGHHQGHRIGHDQPHEAPPDPGPGIARHPLALRGQAGRRQIAAQHQEDLHGHARVLIKPVDELGSGGVGDVGHGPVEGQVVPDDGGTGQALGAVDQRTAASATQSPPRTHRHNAGHDAIQSSSGVEPAVRLAFRRDGQPLGHQPHGGPDLRTAVPVAPAAQCRADRRDAGVLALQREHGAQGIAGLAPGAVAPPTRRPARVFRGAAGCLGDLPPPGRGAPPPRDRAHPVHAARGHAGGSLHRGRTLRPAAHARHVRADRPPHELVRRRAAPVARDRHAAHGHGHGGDAAAGSEGPHHGRQGPRQAGRRRRLITGRPQEQQLPRELLLFEAAVSVLGRLLRVNQFAARGLVIHQFVPHRVEHREGRRQRQAEQPGEIPHGVFSFTDQSIGMATAFDDGHGIDLAAQHAVDPARVGHDQGHEDQRAHQHDEQRQMAGRGVPDREAVLRVQRRGQDEREHGRAHAGDDGRDAQAARQQRQPLAAQPHAQRRQQRQQQPRAGHSAQGGLGPE